jgi:hypothetical protein
MERSSRVTCYEGRPASIDACEVKRVARLVGPAAAAKQRGIARGTVCRLRDQTAAGSRHPDRALPALHERAPRKIGGFALQAHQERLAAAIGQDMPEVGALHRRAD